MTEKRSPEQRLHTIGGLDHQVLQTLLGYNLAQACIPAYALYEQTVGGPLGLRQVEFSILMLLATNEEVTQKSLALALALTAPYLTLVLDKLERRDLLTRSRSERDRRAQIVCLTPAGTALAAQARAAAQSMEENMLAHLSSAERAMLFELLQRVALVRKVAAPKQSAA